jgi:hypothetical protein
MHVELTIKNYRCFPDNRPLRFEIREGFTAFVGVNNSGKSSILRFFYEFRNLLSNMSDPSNLLSLVRGASHSFGVAPNVKDLSEIFCDSNERDLTVEFAFPTQTTAGHPQPSSVVLRIPRNTNRFSITSFSMENLNFATNTAYTSFTPNSLIGISGQNLVLDFREFLDTVQAFVESLYIGAFRNAINAGSTENYFDISVGPVGRNCYEKGWPGHCDSSLRKRSITSPRAAIGGSEPSGTQQKPVVVCGRYMSLLVEGGKYLLGLSRYLHLNPVCGI